MNGSREQVSTNRKSSSRQQPHSGRLSPARRLGKSRSCTSTSRSKSNSNENLNKKTSRELMNPKIQMASDAEEKFVELCVNTGPDGFRDLFKKKLKNYEADGTYKGWEKNKDKNKYTDIKCLDETRVKLVLDSPPETDYIHANWVKMEGSKRNFIAAQSPITNSQMDFWKMIYQEEVPLIMNLSFMDDVKNKCSNHYWPVDPNTILKFRKLTVKCCAIKTTKEANTITSLEVTYEGEERVQNVKLFQLHSWPSQRSPRPYRDLVKILRVFVDPDVYSGTGTIVVHCSAGIGRTATLIFLDILLSLVLKEKVSEMVHIAAIFENLRAARVGAIQSEGDFVLVIAAVLCFLEARYTGQDLRKKCQDFLNDFRDMNIYRG